MRSSDPVQAKQWWRIAFVVYGVLSLSSMAGMSIGLGIFGAATLFFLYSMGKESAAKFLREIFANPFTVTSAALFFASLLSLVAAFIWPVEGTQAGPMLSSLKKYHYYLFPPLFAAVLLRTSDSPERHPFWKAWMIFGSLMGLVAIFQFFAAEWVPSYSWLHSSFFRPAGRTGRYHGQGLMFFHLSFASAMCFVAAAGWSRVIFPLRGDVAKTRALWLLGAILASAGVWFSYSRIAFAAIALVLLVLGFLRKPVWGLLVLLVLGASGFGIWTYSPSMRDRFYHNQSGTKERVRMWETAFVMFEDRPLTGVGFSRTGEVSPWYMKNRLHEPTEFTSHAHNNFLDMLAATGAVGLLAFLSWWGFLFWASWSAFRHAPKQEKWLPAAAFTGFLAFHVNGLTQVNYWDAKSEHTLMVWAGVALALWLRSKRERSFR